MKIFLKKTIGSRKGISWLICEALTVLYFIFRLFFNAPIIYDAIILLILRVSSATTLGLIVFKDIKISYEKK